MDNDYTAALPAADYNEVIGALNPSQSISATSDFKVINTIAGAGTGKTSTMGARIRHLLQIGVPPKSILALSFTNESASEFKSKVEELCGFLGFSVEVGTFHAIFNKYLRKFTGHEFIKDKLGYDQFFIIDSDDQNKLFNESVKAFRPQEKALQDAWGLGRRDFFSELSLHRAKALTPLMYQKRIIKHHPESMKVMEGFYKELLSLPAEEISNFAMNQKANHPYIRDLFMCKLWNGYSRQCKQNSAMDFDDVLCNFFYLIKFNPDVARKIASNISHLLIDEFQDSNPIQVMIVRELLRANPNLNIFIVGDPRQSIYGFRSADVSLMLNAEKHFGQTEVLELDTNYRSSNELLSFTNMFAGGMAGQITDGQLKTGVFHPNISGHPIEVSSHRNCSDEAEFTLTKINEYIDRGVQPKDIYVLYRTRAGVRAFEELLKKNGTPYDMIGEVGFYERADVKDIISYIRVLARPKDILAWARVVDALKPGVADIWLREAYHQNNGTILPRELILGRKTKKEGSQRNEKIDSMLGTMDLISKCLDDNVIFESFVEEQYPEGTISQMKHYVETNAEYAADFNRYRHSYIAEVAQTMAELWIENNRPHWEKDLARKESKVSDSTKSVEDRVQEKVDQKIERVETLIVKFASRLINGDSIVDIADDLMTRITVKQEEDRECIKLMTSHASKGLEAKVVFMLANENEIYHPNASEINFDACMSPSLDANDELAEAQRLFYVSMTRATSNLHLSYAENRMVNGLTTSREPLTMMTKLVNKFRSEHQHWESILKIDHHPMNQLRTNGMVCTHQKPQNHQKSTSSAPSISARLPDVNEPRTDVGSNMPESYKVSDDVKERADEVMRSMGFSG